MLITVSPHTVRPPAAFHSGKSESKRTKHGIDFVQARRLWSDHKLLEIPAKADDEPRYLAIGLMDGTHWSAVITYRGEDIRLIAVRRARPEEVSLYESQNIRATV